MPLEQQELNEDLSSLTEDLQLIEGFFDKWKSRPTPKKIEPLVPSKSQIDDDLTNSTNISLDHFKNNDDLVCFISLLSNLNNIKEIKDKKQFIENFRKYRELLDILMIAFPYIKTKGREFGMVIPKLVENVELTNKVKKLFHE
jgi:hypothetical protein